MKTEKRRENIIRMLSQTTQPISGSKFSECFCVSRQIVVSDIAILKSQGYNILSTNKGYIIAGNKACRKVIKVRHSDKEIEKELNAIVDLGGRVVDVFIKHRIYGELHAPLYIASRRDINDFLDNIKSGKSVPLSNITSGYHYHTVEAETTETIAMIESALLKMGMLAEFLDYEVENKKDE
ncbi:MAG: transcription repressor NadR [Bacillota bacterium]|nr:transcription repressor NadR [Bacillota bacterium]